MVATLAAENTVSTLVRAMLPEFGSLPHYLEDSSRYLDWDPKTTPTKALYVSVHLRLSTYSEEGEEDGESRMVHFVFERPSNYTKVFTVVDDAWSIPKPEAFVMKSDHDSCWRSDGLRDLSTVYLEMLHLLRERNPELRVSEFNIIREIKWVEISYEPIDPKDRYRKKITSIKEIR